MDKKLYEIHFKNLCIASLQRSTGKRVNAIEKIIIFSDPDSITNDLDGFLSTICYCDSYEITSYRELTGKKLNKFIGILDVLNDMDQSIENNSDIVLYNANCIFNL